ncbi:MAG: hypothetical protein NC925_02875 [Candidatus Omnitrophica bacterium]|nr:hypothetical protein [Candidatus Omnitrophota bacterium]
MIASKKLKMKLNKFIIVLLSLPFSGLITYSYMGGGISSYDSGLYHLHTVETIKKDFFWIGLGNLHDRLAFNNSNFYLIAFIEKFFPNIKSYYVFNPLAYFSLITYLLYQILHYKNKSIFQLIYFSIPLLILSKEPLFIVSTSPDTISYCIGIFLFTEIIVIQRITKKNYLIYFFIYFILVTVKVSSIFYGLVFLPFLSKNFKNLNFLHLILLSTIVFLPWVIRSIVISGYIIYPILPLPFIDIPWKIPSETGDMHRAVIKYWAISSGKDYREIFNTPFYKWVPVWYHFWSKNNIHGSMQLFHFYKIGISLFIVAFSLSILILKSNYLFKNFEIKNLSVYTFILFVINLFWFFSAPDPRFSYASLIVFVALLFSFSLGLAFSILKNFSIRIDKKCIVLFFIINLFYWNSMNWQRLENIKLDATIPSPPVVKKVTNYGVEVLVPTLNDQCWKIALNCTPYFNPKLAYWDKEKKYGYKVEKDHYGKK